MIRKPRKLDTLVTCMVPVCKNTVRKHPNKHFFYVPKSTRVQWCAAVNKKNVPKSGSIYICEDHLNIEEDVVNYKDWIDNKVTRPRLKPQVPNSLFNIGKEACLRFVENEDILSPTQEKEIQCIPDYCSKSVQVKPQMIHRSVNTSNHKKIKPTLPTIDDYLSEEQNPSTAGSTTEFSENESSTDVPKGVVQSTLVGRSFILKLIENKPFAYIGVPTQYYWIVQHFGKEFKIPVLYIITTLYKIKNNETFSRMKDIFEVSIVTLWRKFYTTLKALSLFFKQLIYWPLPQVIKKNLPSAFSTNKNYASVHIIIDCFDIEIEKPKKSIDQALTWSQYKNCNTIKYLIGATPDGFISFVSEGYGGRISDIYLVEQSGFLEVVPAQATILCDRGFKHLESHLIQKSAKVLRPPSVLKDTKMMKSEVIDTKILASLRIHIERVIRRVRLFKMLKPHAVVNNKLINVLDDVVVVAWGLINLQSPILQQK